MKIIINQLTLWNTVHVIFEETAAVVTVAGLAKANTFSVVLQADRPAIRLSRDLTKEQMQRALVEGFKVPDSATQAAAALVASGAAKEINQMS